MKVLGRISHQEMRKPGELSQNDDTRVITMASSYPSEYNGKSLQDSLPVRYPACAVWTSGGFPQWTTNFSVALFKCHLDFRISIGELRHRMLLAVGIRPLAEAIALFVAFGDLDTNCVCLLIVCLFLLYLRVRGKAGRRDAAWRL